jgi:hypothetical protein
MQLRSDMALVCGEPVPAASGHGVATLALRVVIVERQFVLRLHVASRGGFYNFVHTATLYER